jgi:hypothetical protein
MKSTQGQTYTPSLFFAGLAANIDPEMIDAKSGAFLEAHYMHVSNVVKHILTKHRGDTVYISDTDMSIASTLIGGTWVGGYLVEFWYNTTNGTDIYANGIHVGQSLNLPGNLTHFLDIDTNSETLEMFITDNDQCPVVLDLGDMVAAYATTTFFANYDKSLYEINQPVQLNMVKFVQLENLGDGGGLKTGSYSYAMRYSRINGEHTPWGPISPYIPVPHNYMPSPVSYAVPSIAISGEAPSLTPTDYGIRLRFRITNNAAFDYIELKRYSNQSGQPVNYTPIPESVIVALDATGTAVDIRTNPYTIIDFVDSNTIAWGILDDSVVSTYSTIKTARTVRYFDRRIVLGGVSYESKLLSDQSIFIQHSDVAKTFFPIQKKLDVLGYANPFNQVFYKSYRLGERYGFAAKLYDNQGNTLFAIPLTYSGGIEYQFPNRRDIVPSAERAYSPDLQQLATINSRTGADVNYVYEPVGNALYTKSTGTSGVSHNIISRPNYDYAPLTPTSVDSNPLVSVRNNRRHVYDYSHAYENMSTADGQAYNTARHGIWERSTGLSIGGIDTTKLPSWVKGFSIVRTPAAGRVVCQGIAMYSLIPQANGSSPSLVKNLGKVWFYSPEIDSIIGDKVSIFDDMKLNPSNYKMQLVSPVGFFTDIYSSYQNSGDGGNNIKTDMLSCAIMQGGVHNMEPSGFDTSGQIGWGDDNVSFGKFRNQSSQASLPSDLIFTISGANEVILSGNGVYKIQPVASRTPFLELTLGVNIYANNNVLAESGNTSQSRGWHEPWYIVNIIQDGNHVANNNINSYKDIGHYIKLNSIIGQGTGTADQTFKLIDERYEDVCSLGESATQYRYIWVDGKRWLSFNNISPGTQTTYRTAWDTYGYFTPSGGPVCYGAYYVTGNTALDTVSVISFPYYGNPSGTPIVPAMGASIVVKYDNHSPFQVFLGDSVVDDAYFAPIDTVSTAPDGTNYQFYDQGIRIAAPMPYYSFAMNNVYLMPRDPGHGTASAWTEPTGTKYLQYVRQWLVNFGCESTVNLPFVYSNRFPNQNYIMRPAIYDAKTTAQSVADYLTAIYVATDYNDDYPDEYLNWKTGGFTFPIGYNMDYNKRIHTQVFTQPTTGSLEILVRPKRIHYSLQGLAGYPSSKAFIPTNIYDLQNDKPSQISILYDAPANRTSYGTVEDNLYVITDRGIAMLITGKTMIRDMGGNQLGILAANASLIQGEVWLNPSAGCPGELWRGKTEGNLRLSNNVITPVLIFFNYRDVMIFTGNTFLGISDSNKKLIRDQLASIDSGGTTFNGMLYSYIDERQNKLVVRIGTKSLYFDVELNNWDMIRKHNNSVKDVVKSIYCPWIGTQTNRETLANIFYDPSTIKRSVTLDSDTITPVNTPVDVPYVIFSVTPALGTVRDFVDMFISSTYKPYSVTLATDLAFTDPATVAAAAITTYNNGWHYIKGLPKTAGGKRLIGKTLFVKVTFQDHANAYDLKSVYTGHKDVAGS